MMKSQSYIPPKSLIILLGALVAFGPLSIDMYLPSLPSIAHDLATSINQAQKTITFFLIAFSLGMLIYGPLSDRYGRKKLLTIGMVIYIVATIGCIFAAHIEQLQILRLLQAIGGASASVLSRALVRDLYSNEEIPKVLSLMQIITMIATLIAPLLGALIVSYFSWNSIFTFLAIYAVICFIWVFLAVQTPNTTPSKQSIIQNYASVLSNRNAVAFILCMGFIFGGMFAYITASSFVFIEYYHLTENQYALLFACNIIAIILFTTLNKRLLTQYSVLKLLQSFTIISAISGIYLILLAVFNIHSVWLLMLGLLTYIGVTGPIGTNTIANLLLKLPQQAGTASGLAVAIQFLMGALMSFIITLFFHAENPIAMNYVVGFCGLMSCLIIFGLYKKV